MLFGVAAAAGPVTDFAFHDLAGLGVVVDALRPLRKLRGVAGLAKLRALEFGFVVGDFRHRVAAIVAIFIERFVDKKISGRDSDDGKTNK